MSPPLRLVGQKRVSSMCETHGCLICLSLCHFQERDHKMHLHRCLFIFFVSYFSRSWFVYIYIYYGSWSVVYLLCYMVIDLWCTMHGSWFSSVFIIMLMFMAVYDYGHGCGLLWLPLDQVWGCCHGKCCFVLQFI